MTEHDRAVVVLGGYNENKRLDKALFEYTRDPGAALVVSGFGKHSGRVASSLEDVLYETESLNTEDNAINSISIIKQKLPLVKRITIVSDYAHRIRSEVLFKRHAAGEYEIDFLGIKTESKLRRVLYELIAFPLLALPYSHHRKLTQIYRRF